MLFLFSFYCDSSQKRNSKSGLLSNIGHAIDGGEVIPLKLRASYIYNVRNRTYTSDISAELTHRIQLEVNKQGRLVVVEKPEEAHILVYTSLQFYKVLPLAWDTIGRPVSYEILAACVVKVRKTVKGKGSVLLIDPTKVEARILFNSGAAGIASEFQAKRDLLDILAARIAKTVETGWYTDLKSERELGQAREKELTTKELSIKARDEKKVSLEKNEQEEISEMEEKSYGKKQKNNNSYNDNETGTKK